LLVAAKTFRLRCVLRLRRDRRSLRRRGKADHSQFTEGTGQEITESSSNQQETRTLQEEDTASQHGPAHLQEEEGRAPEVDDGQGETCHPKPGREKVRVETGPRSNGRVCIMDTDTTAATDSTGNGIVATNWRHDLRERNSFDLDDNSSGCINRRDRLPMQIGCDTQQEHNGIGFKHGKRIRSIRSPGDRATKQPMPGTVLGETGQDLHNSGDRNERCSCCISRTTTCGIGLHPSQQEDPIQFEHRRCRRPAKGQLRTGVHLRHRVSDERNDSSLRVVYRYVNSYTDICLLVLLGFCNVLFFYIMFNY